MGRVDVDGVGIEYDVTGEGPPVVLLHGFPDSGRLWRHQVSALAGAGFQVIVPDLRGYGRSDKPEAIEAYSLLLLAGDVMAIMAELQVPRAHVVGHDWGAALAWALASFAPDTVDHLVSLSVGHPATFRRTARQREKSWYMLLFQFPGIAERWLTEDDWFNFRTWAGHPDADQVIAELEATGSLTPGLNWYRANVPPESWVSPPLQLPPVQAPTMGIWSTGDPALTEIQMTDSTENVAGPWRYERLDGPGHWMQLDAPDQVNALLLDFLRLSGSGKAASTGHAQLTTGGARAQVHLRHDRLPDRRRRDPPFDHRTTQWCIGQSGLTGDFAARSRAAALTKAAALLDEETRDPAAERDEAPFRRQE